MAQSNSFSCLIRFQDDESKQVYWGDLQPTQIKSGILGQEATVLDGDIQSGFTKTNRKRAIHHLLSPIPATNLVQCIGLNYKQHAAETNLSIPTTPVTFVKPPDAIAGPYDDIHIHAQVQQKLDYEGELTVLIGRDAKNVSVEDAMTYVLGYTIGNDLSARDWQVPNSVSGGQYGYAKSFDGFAPLGPCIISRDLIADPHDLQLQTRVNGELRQKTSTSDMIWSVSQIIEHLSRGTTLRAGTSIMTGTPSGVGMFRSPPEFLRDGDVVEIGIGGLGMIRNRIVFG